MADPARRLSNGAERIDFQTDPSRFRHWKLAADGDTATLTMDIDETAGLHEGYLLKLNSYDLGVDIELADALQRLRFEHPHVKSVLLRSGKNRVFCAGANIRMLAGSTHAHKVNFCKFTNETRNGMEDSAENSGQHFICVVNGTAAGGGYELALAAEHIILVDDGAAAVALPEVPLLAVLPGTGGLTRVTDKRKVRRDHADFFCTIEEGIKGKRAVQWRLVDEIAPASKIEALAMTRAKALAAASSRKGSGAGVTLTPLQRSFRADGVDYSCVGVTIDRAQRVVTITLRGPGHAASSLETALAEGAQFWPLRLARELDDAILHIRANEAETAAVIFKSEGDAAQVLGFDKLLEDHASHWMINEIRHYWKRVLKRIDVTSRTLVALIEPGSCFAGTLFELALAADRSYMLYDKDQPSAIAISAMNGGAYPMTHGMSRLAVRFYGDPDKAAAIAATPRVYDPTDAEEAGLVTVVADDIDYLDEVRVAIEERVSLSPDALTGMEASLRFPGAESGDSKIFARLSAWQNWIFQRENAVGPRGALTLYGKPERPVFDFRRT